MDHLCEMQTKCLDGAEIRTSPSWGNAQEGHTNTRGGGGGMTMRSKAPKSQRLGGIYLVITVSFMSSSYSYFEHMKKESWSSISSYEAPS